MTIEPGYLGLPRVDPDYFNQYLSQNFVKWGDGNGNGIPDPDEVVAVDPPQQDSYVVTDANGKKQFTPRFNEQYRLAFEIRRELLVKTELEGRRIITISTDFGGGRYSPETVAMASHILKAGKLIEEIFQVQIGSHRFAGQLAEIGTDVDWNFFQRTQGVECETSDPLCSGIRTFERQESIIPEDDSCDYLLKSGPFTVVRKSAGGGFAAVPYSEYPQFNELLEAASQELILAAEDAERIRYTSGEIKDEAYLAKYLRAAANALTTNNYADADRAWISMFRNSKFFLRLGPDEALDFGKCNSKAAFHLIFGFIDESSSLAKPGNEQQLEDYLASIIGSSYTRRTINASPTAFVRLISAFGHARYGRGGNTAMGQNLPAWPDTTGYSDKGKISYVNRGVVRYADEVLRAFASFISNMGGFEPGFHRPDAVVFHEMGHEVGPTPEMISSDGKTTLREKLSSYLGRLEELKGYLTSLYGIGKYNPTNSKDIYTALFFDFFSFLRVAAARPFNENDTYPQVAAVIIGYFIEQKAISFDGKTRQFTIHYKRIPDATRKLLEITGRIYATGDLAGATNLFKKYTEGEGLQSLHVDIIGGALGGLKRKFFVFEVNLPVTFQ